MRALSLALRSLAREWRSGELGVLLLALTVAVGALTGVGFLVSRISTAVALQASEVVKLLLGIGEPAVGRLVTFDALRLRFRELTLRKDPHCPVCSAARTSASRGRPSSSTFATIRRRPGS